MQKKLMSTYILIIMLTVIIVVIFSWQSGTKYFNEQVKLESKMQGQVLHDVLTYQEALNKLDFSEFVKKYSEITNVRITIIDMNGNVIADSNEDYRIMDNHAYREEVAAAIKGEVYSIMRFSQTMGTYYAYTARPLQLSSFNGVLRTAIPLNEVQELVLDILEYIILGILIGAVVSIIIAYFYTQKFMEPINEITEAAIKISEGNYDKKLYINLNDQRGKLADAFNDMSVKLSMNMWKLEQRKSQLESILSSMDTGIIAIDKDFTIFLYNQKLIEIFDIEQENIKGKSIYEVVRNATIFQILEKSMNQHKFSVEEISFIGEERIIKINANPIISSKSGNKFLGILLVIQDITKIKKLENMRKDFVSNVTHELKTPLTSIRGFVETLRHGAIKDEKIANRFLDIIDIEGERLYKLIEDILLLSEIESMKDKNVSNHSIKQIVKEVYDILEPKASKKEIHLETYMGEDIIFRCNKDRIKQLLINLADNALNYTEKGYVKITVNQDYYYVTFEIEDTGIGIEQEFIPRLFERFYRVDKGRGRKVGGTGLGLSIVKHIVELYEGTINVESKPGVGTKFTVKLKKVGKNTA